MIFDNWMFSDNESPTWNQSFYQTFCFPDYVLGYEGFTEEDRLQTYKENYLDILKRIDSIIKDREENPEDWKGVHNKDFRNKVADFIDWGTESVFDTIIQKIGFTINLSGFDFSVVRMTYPHSVWDSLVNEKPMSKPSNEIHYASFDFKDKDELTKI